MAERIVGKVARVNSDRELVINRGAEHGVGVDEYFYVRGDLIEIKDPDSGDVLGEVTPIKAVVQVREVGEKFCIARTFRTRRVKVDEGSSGGSFYKASSFSQLGDFLQPPRRARYEQQTETLRFDPGAGSPIDEWESVVNVGDLVESLLEGESLDPATTTLFR